MIINQKTFQELDSLNKCAVYCGFDPTAESLHVGSLLPLITLKRFAELGHPIVALIGGATGLIGDPSGKKDERNLQSEEEVAFKVNKLSKQISSIVPDAIIVDNNSWYKNMNTITFLRDIGKHFPVNEMLARDSVSSRLTNGISFTEFAYQLMQTNALFNNATEAKPVFVKKGTNLIDILVETKLCPSKSQARRDISGGGVSVDGEKIFDPFWVGEGLIKKGKTPVKVALL